MRYLIDSHILVFYWTDAAELTADVKDILDDYANRIYIPAKCVEELMYLQQSGKINTKRWKSPEDILRTVNDWGVGIKHTADEHLWTLARLPLLPEHKDPTDRVIIAQAITEKIPIISSDRKFPLYKRYGLELVFNER
jgi:PIN domain nuclease of toxin-antitoxin system